MPGQVGPSGGSGGGGITGISTETATGAVNGVNTDFSFSAPPICVLYQGIVQNGGDYTVNGSTVTFHIPPVSGSVMGLIAS